MGRGIDLAALGAQGEGTMLTIGGVVNERIPVEAAIESRLNEMRAVVVSRDVHRQAPDLGLSNQAVASKIATHLRAHGWIIAHIDDPLPPSPTLHSVLWAAVRAVAHQEGCALLEEGSPCDFDHAWLHHQHHNPHHWQHYVLREDDGQTKMPAHFAREMVADWTGAGRAITGSRHPGDWYAKNQDRILLAPATRALVHRLLLALPG